MLKLKRIYEETKRGDGYRVLVDHLWPRGVSKEKAQIDLWLKDISPSTELRQWFGHDEHKWTEFQKRYRAELKDKKEAIKELKNVLKKEKNVALLYSAHDELHNNAVALVKILKLR